MSGTVTLNDGIKWFGRARVIKYDQSTVDEITRDIGHEPSGEDLRWLESRYGLVPDGVSEWSGNLLTTLGLDRVTKLIIGGAGNAFTNANAMVGVGDHGGNSTQSQAVGDTDLAAATGATHRYIQGADASNPTQANGVITCNATFTSSNGNFAWNEWALGIATGAITPSGASTFASVAGTSAVMLNHAVPVSSFGTKASGSWTLQATITLS